MSALERKPVDAALLPDAAPAFGQRPCRPTSSTTSTAPTAAMSLTISQLFPMVVVLSDVAMNPV